MEDANNLQGHCHCPSQIDEIKEGYIISGYYIHTAPKASDGW